VDHPALVLRMSSVFRCFVPQASRLEAGQTCVLPEAEAHHLVHVLRAQNGSELHLLDGEGCRLRARLAIQKHQIAARVEEKMLQPPPKCRITLAPGLLKNDAMDWLFREATALGVRQMVPVIAQRSVSKISPDQVVQKMEHWRSVVIAACKQSGQLFLPTIASPQGLENYLSSPFSGSHLLLVGKLDEGTETLWNELGTIAARQAVEAVVLFMGPEGDFTPEEYRLLADKGAHAIRLSRQILRAETASIYALSVIDQWRQCHESSSRR